MNQLLLFTTLVCCIASCKTKNSIEEDTTFHIEAIHTTAREILDKKPTIIPNENSSLFLCYHNPEAQSVRFIVLDHDANLVLPIKRIKGQVTWYSVSSLAVQSDPGHPGSHDAEPIVTIIDLSFKKEEF